MVIAINFTSIIGILLIALTVYSGAFIIPILFGLTGIQVNQKSLTPAMIIGGIVAFTGKIIFYTGCTDAGNYIIISSFLINGMILFWGTKKPHRIPAVNNNFI